MRERNASLLPGFFSDQLFRRASVQNRLLYQRLKSKYPGVTRKNLASKGEVPGNTTALAMGYLRYLPPTAVLAPLLVGLAARLTAATFTDARLNITYDVTLRSQPRVRERVRSLAAEQLERVDVRTNRRNFNRRTHQTITPLVGKPYLSRLGYAAAARGASARSYPQAR